MVCHNCKVEAHKYGKNRKKQQRFHCLQCNRTFIDDSDAKPLDNMRIPEDKAVMVLQLLLEGNSIRSTERITGVHRNTIFTLLEVVGQKCERFLNEKIRNIEVTDVQIDEVFGFVEMKEATKHRLALDANEDIGNAYCFLAIERKTKLVLAWHLGKRSGEDAMVFMQKLDRATSDTRYQLSSDSYQGFNHSVRPTLAHKVDYGQVAKTYGKAHPGIAYSPLVVIHTKKRVKFGNPDKKKICTSHIERFNLDIRTKMKRMVRATICFSKKWANLHYAYALNILYVNYCWKHSTIKMTPAQASGLADRQWSVRDMLLAVA